MSKIKFFFSVLVFSFFILGTSIIKNETRELEKNIYNLNKIVQIKEKDLNETQLDYSYLSSPSKIEEKIDHLDNKNYLPMELSKIFLSIKYFINLNNKLVNQEYIYEKKTKKK